MLVKASSRNSTSAECPFQYDVDDVPHWICYVANSRGWADLRFLDLTDFAAEEAIL